MNELLTKHKAEIFELFKQQFHKTLKKNKQVEFNSILNELLETLKIINYNESDISYLKEWYDNIYNLDFIFNPIKENIFNELIFHSNCMFQCINKKEKTSHTYNQVSIEDYQLALEILAEKNTIDWNFINPFCSFTKVISNTPVRFTLIHYGLTPNKLSKVFIRKHQEASLDLNSFTSSSDVKKSLEELIKSKANLLIVGSTNSGKTTLLNGLLELTPKDEHIVVIEDTNEIKSKRDNITNLLGDEKTPGKSLSDYCSYAMRMSPDRIILGEMRSIEVIPFLLAMNSGHNGLISTIHANSAFDAIARIQLLFSIYSSQNKMNPNSITSLICKNLDYIIFMKDLKIHEIVKVLGNDQETPFTEQIYLNCA